MKKYYISVIWISWFICVIRVTNQFTEQFELFYADESIQTVLLYKIIQKSDSKIHLRHHSEYPP